MAVQTIKEMVQEFCKRQGLTVPTTVATSSDPAVIQYVALLNEEQEGLVRNNTLTPMVVECTFNSVATESQGAIDTLAGFEVASILNDIIWNRTQRLPVLGPLGASAWQQMKATNITGPILEYRIRGGLILMLPIPAAGQSMAMEVVRKFPVLSLALTAKRYFTADDDTSVLPSDLLIAALRWRWRREKGLPYAENFRDYQNLLAAVILKDGTKRTLDMSGTPRDMRPGVLVPPGSWPL